MVKQQGQAMSLQEENHILNEKLKAAEELIKKLEIEHTTAFLIGDAVSDGICVVDRNGVVTEINRGYTEITGIKPEDIVGKTIMEMIENDAFSNAVSLEVLEKKQKISSMATVRKNNRQVLLVGTPFLDENNEIVKVITVMRNLTEINKLKEELEEAERKKRMYREELESLIREKTRNPFVGKNPTILRVKELIEHVAPTDATVLITGETGSGKEVVAREIYQRSHRKNGPYIKVNCSAIPENLLESELFGYVRGAFTGADKKDKKGLFEMADHGTILLDEIGEMPIKLQTKLLRVLQERELTRVGGTESIKIDVRIIVSTNENLSELIRSGQFRADLFYRLNVFPIKLPSLRERRDDIPEIAATFLTKFNRLYDKHKIFGQSAITALVRYNWPGNVRELENIIERIVIISPNKTLTSDDVEMILYMGEKKQSQSKQFIFGTMSLKEAVQRYEKEILESALKEYGSSYAVAEALKTTQPTVVRKAKALGISLRKNGI
ncbi:MAG: sigma 54-interacting transcriptional regulator [Eubacteriaceae bacterium]|nr:sigma 54-interacting transcriptional regulator [Eubacteriaceae bacterium]